MAAAPDLEYILLWLLTWVKNWKPVVEFILVGNSVELAALHLPKRRRARGAGVDVAQAIALSFPRAVLPAKLWPINGTHNLFC